MMTFYIKQNDTAPALRATLKDGDENVVDLTGASVKFHMKAIDGSTVKTDDVASVITPATDGVVQYNWIAEDTDTVGSFHAEFEVTHSDTTVETFPNNGYIRVEITDDIT